MKIVTYACQRQRCYSVPKFYGNQPTKRPFMCTDRRDFLRLSAGIAGAALLGNSLGYAHSESIEPQQAGSPPEAIRRLRRMTDNVVPITMEERQSRIDK